MFAMVPGERLPCGLVNFEGANDPVGVVGVEAAGCFRIAPGQPFVQGFNTQGFTLPP